MLRTKVTWGYFSNYLWSVFIIGGYMITSKNVVILAGGVKYEQIN